MSTSQPRQEVTHADVERAMRLVRRLTFVLVPVTANAVAVQIVA